MELRCDIKREGINFKLVYSEISMSKIIRTDEMICHDMNAVNLSLFSFSLTAILSHSSPFLRNI